MFRSLSRLAIPCVSAGSVQAGTKSFSHRPTIATLAGIVRRRQSSLTVATLSTNATVTTTNNLVTSSTPALLPYSHKANSQHAGNVWWWWSMAAAMATATVGTLGDGAPVTLCDNTSNDHEHKSDDDDGQEDPYDNLPEQDEPTHCSICLTYRQGPCRPYWRKVEACTKDHEFKKKNEDDNGDNDSKTKTSKATNEGEGEDEEQLEDPPCLKYMLPWIDCATGYRNLYALIELDTNYTMGIADLENEATVQVCWAPSHEPTVDWSPWQDYVANHPHWKLPKRSTNKNTTSPDANDHHVSLWKTLGTDRDPEMVEILASVPSQQGQGILECAYAVDQDGNVLGFSYGTKPSEVAAKSSSDPDSQGDAEESTGTPVELKIRLLPLHTRNVTIAGAYTQPTKEGAKENDPLESHIFKSRPFSLKKMGKQ